MEVASFHAEIAQDSNANQKQKKLSGYQMQRKELFGSSGTTLKVRFLYILLSLENEKCYAYRFIYCVYVM